MNITTDPIPPGAGASDAELLQWLRSLNDAAIQRSDDSAQLLQKLSQGFVRFHSSVDSGALVGGLLSLQTWIALERALEPTNRFLRFLRTWERTRLRDRVSKVFSPVVAKKTGQSPKETPWIVQFAHELIRLRELMLPDGGDFLAVLDCSNFEKFRVEACERLTNECRKHLDSNARDAPSSLQAAFRMFQRLWLFKTPGSSAIPARLGVVFSAVRAGREVSNL